MNELEFVVDLPDPAFDRKLKPCPRCHTTHIDIGHAGPTILYFSKNMYQAICEACFYRTLPGRTPEEALHNWENDITERMMHKLRTDQGYTQPQLATLAGVNTTTISNIERGVYRGSQATRKKIAHILGVSQNIL